MDENKDYVKRNKPGSECMDLMISLMLTCITVALIEDESRMEIATG